MKSDQANNQVSQSWLTDLLQTWKNCLLATNSCKQGWYLLFGQKGLRQNKNEMSKVYQNIYG